MKILSTQVFLHQILQKILFGGKTFAIFHCIFSIWISYTKDIQRNLQWKKKKLRNISCNCFEAEVKLWIIRKNVLVPYPVDKTLFNISTFVRPALHTHAQHPFFFSWYTIKSYNIKIKGVLTCKSNFNVIFYELPWTSDKWDARRFRNHCFEARMEVLLS